MTPGRRALLVAFVVATLSSPALAESTLWQRAAKPESRAEAQLLIRLERMLDQANHGGMFEFGLDRELVRDAVRLIETSGVKNPSNPLLAYVEARALIEADIGRDADARRLLEGALERLPPGSRAAAAWNTLATALGRLDDAVAQYRAYTRVIELTWDPEIRALAFYNRGEVSMHGRDLAAARSDYQRAVADSRDPSLVALARYGLAVAEERLGDLPAAYAALDKAALTKLPMPPFLTEDPLDLPSVYFEPPYEENYIRALRAMAAGRSAQNPNERQEAYEIAVAEWDTYLARAPDTELFRENARTHRARSARELEQPKTAKPRR